jgi:magnesium transporter
MDLAREDIVAALKNPEGCLWVDFENTPPESDEPFLREVFCFHPLAIDDALIESHVPKVDDWGEYLYIVLHSVEFNPQDGGELNTLELDVFLGDNYLVTHHDQKIPALETVWKSIQRDERHVHGGPDHILYRLTDEVVASYMPVVEEIDMAIDHAEDQIFDRPTPGTLEQIFMLKRAALHLRRIIGPQREVLNKLARDDYRVIDARDRVYFRDVYDHLVRMYDIVEGLRDMVGGALDSYLSVTSNRINEVMRTLTVVTVLFMPISFLSGFFGMNFFGEAFNVENPFRSTVLFWLCAAVIVLLPPAMLWWMARRGWLSSLRMEKEAREMTRELKE